MTINYKAISYMSSSYAVTCTTFGQIEALEGVC